MLHRKLPRLLSCICMAIIMILNFSILAYAEGENTVEDSAAVISFVADSYYIGPNQSATLSWSVKNAEKVELENLPGYDIPTEGSMEIWPTETTTFVLKVYEKTGEIVTRKLMINVVFLEIKNFSASEEEVLPGESVLITWDVPGASDVLIKEITPKYLPFDGTLEVNPYVTTKYTLEAYGLDGSMVTRELTVKVKEPEVQTFSVDNPEIYPGESAVLTWDASNFKSVKITGVDKEGLPLSGSEEVKPLNNTTYTLEAVTYDGKIKTKEITVKVKNLNINSFNADRTVITKGGIIKLSWITENAVYCNISTNFGHKLLKRQPNGTIAVTPNKNIVYLLTAVDKFGKEMTQSVEITVNN